MSGNLPDLVIIDGGKGHLEAALRAFDEIWEHNSALRPMVIAVAKKPDRAFLQGVQEPLDLSGRKPSSVLLRRLRDEVHRFSVSFHKRLRGKRLLESPLESIPGIGKKRRLALLRKFKSLEAIREASMDELVAVEGMNLKAAQAVSDALSAQDVPGVMQEDGVDDANAEE